MKALVFTALLLLGLTSVASAECAWALWYQDTFFGPNALTESPSWLLLTAVPTYALCERTQTERIKNAAKPQQGAEITVTGTIVSKTMRDSEGRTVSWVSRFECLPDTVDPRGPKGK
jgi:hypothetical protein